MGTWGLPVAAQTQASSLLPSFSFASFCCFLFCQEFELPDVLALWDGFIADSGRPLPLLYYVCVSIIIWVRSLVASRAFRFPVGIGIVLAVIERVSLSIGFAGGAARRS